VFVRYNVGFDIRMLAQVALPSGTDFTIEYFDTNRYTKRLKQAKGWEKTKLVENLNALFEGEILDQVGNAL